MDGFCNWIFEVCPECSFRVGASGTIATDGVSMNWSGDRFQIFNIDFIIDSGQDTNKPSMLS
mgnify:CR=1 FL=1